jgi:hypothetical protein
MTPAESEKTTNTSIIPPPVKSIETEKTVQSDEVVKSAYSDPAPMITDTRQMGVTENGMVADTYKKESEAEANSDKKSMPLAKMQTLAKSTEEGPIPEIGWSAYTNYVNRNRETANALSNTSGNPVVVLSFEVGIDGRPKDIIVKESAGTYYDNKAMELLKKGAGWIPGKNNKRGELRVPF